MIKKNNNYNLNDELTPKEIVLELDKYVIGQENAKKAVAIALRNRSRRKCVPLEIQNEIAPKNIMMIGNTGVGKTEIARRLANLVNAPFIKVEATKFTEIGYVGRDVESIIRDLLNVAIDQEKKRMREEISDEATRQANEKILSILLPHLDQEKKNDSFSVSLNINSEEDKKKNQEDKNSFNKTREKFVEKLKKKELEDKLIEIEIQKPLPKIGSIEFSNPNEQLQNPGNMIKSILGSLNNNVNIKKKIPISKARSILKEQFTETLIDLEKVYQKAIEVTENMGIVFVDEIDKIVSKESNNQIQISRQGVQRDLLPLVEGCVVNTKYGVLNTNHILFIAAGAFHTSSVSDIIPELQGRFPIRVELEALTEENFVKILKEPRNSLLMQYSALMETEGVKLGFTNGAIKKIAHICQQANSKINDIGARRLSTIMENLLENILFEEYIVKKKITIDEKFVQTKLDKIITNEDMSRYIL